MPNFPSSLLEHYLEAQSIVDIERELIDTHSLYGFINDYNDEWLMLKKIYDFYVEGIHLLRRKDITALKTSKTGDFQKQLLIEEGVLAKIDFSTSIPKGGIPELLASLPKDKVIIFEEETEHEEEDIFDIGFINKAEGNEIHLISIAGDASLDDEPLIIDLDDITSISYDTNYTLHYERYFQRKKFSE